MELPVRMDRILISIRSLLIATTPYTKWPLGMDTPAIWAAAVSRRAMVAPATRVWVSGMVAAMALEEESAGPAYLLSAPAEWGALVIAVAALEGPGSIVVESSSGCWIRMILL